MKTSELSGVALDWAVAKCEGHGIGVLDDPWFAPSTNWAQGGKIIERERLCITPRDGYWDCLVHDRLFEDDGSDYYATGETPLIAAMRCYVASKLGNEVDIPEEVCNGQR